MGCPTAAAAASASTIIAVRRQFIAAAARPTAAAARPTAAAADLAPRPRVPWFAITAASYLLVVCAACSTSAPARPWPPHRATGPAPGRAHGPAHDPDLARGTLPSAVTRRNELALVRRDLDAMYAHRIAKLARYHLDEDAIFAAAERALVAARSWIAYDAALYAALAQFHDGHLGYRPPRTAAPARGYASFRLGLRTVLARDRLLVSEVDPGSDVAAAGVQPGDEVTRIDDHPVADVLAAEARRRADARAESAFASFAKTWTAVLMPHGDPPRPRTIDVRRRSGGAVHVAIAPRPPSATRHPVIAIAHRGDVAIATLESFEGGTARAAAIDTVLGEARGAKAIVIDLRGNRGGVDKVGARVVADLAEGHAALGTYRVLVAPETLARRPMWNALVAEADGFSAPQPLTVTALPARYPGPVAVVIDAGCISTCEIVAAALRADLGATLVGETTGGSSGAPLSVVLPASRGSVQIPTWNLVAADGKPIEDDGVVPDLDAVATPEALAAGRDLPLETAIDRVTARLTGAAAERTKGP